MSAHPPELLADLSCLCGAQLLSETVIGEPIGTNFLGGDWALFSDGAGSLLVSDLTAEGVPDVNAPLVRGIELWLRDLEAAVKSLRRKAPVALDGLGGLMRQLGEPAPQCIPCENASPGCIDCFGLGFRFAPTRPVRILDADFDANALGRFLTGAMVVRSPRLALIGVLGITYANGMRVPMVVIDARDWIVTVAGLGNPDPNNPAPEIALDLVKRRKVAR